MTHSNLAIVFGPNLVWSRTEAASLAGTPRPPRSPLTRSSHEQDQHVRARALPALRRHLRLARCMLRAGHKVSIFEMADPQFTDPAGARKRTTSFADDQNKAGAHKCVLDCAAHLPPRCGRGWNAPRRASRQQCPGRRGPHQPLL